MNLNNTGFIPARKHPGIGSQCGSDGHAHSQRKTKDCPLRCMTSARSGEYGAQKVVSKGWGTVHPFARYMAGAVPPQNLVIFAPRDSREFAVVTRIIEASHGYATGRIGNIALPDTRW
ncbi:MAG: hypothetical protein WCA28_24740 [Bradyrhizobium sp.]